MRMIQSGLVTSAPAVPHRIRVCHGGLRSSGHLKDLFQGSEITVPAGRTVRDTDRMKLLFIHGSPAVGKLTVAKALLRIVPGRLMDNHAAIDLALTVFEFGAPGFWKLVHDVRYSALDAAAKHNVPLLVTTFCYAEPEDREQFGQIEAIVQLHGAKLLPVFLHCSREEVLRRVGNPDRVARRKISSGDLVRELDRYNLTAVPRSDCLRLDTGVNAADVTAQEIVRHFGLDA
jgi:hypothetical protein